MFDQSVNVEYSIAQENTELSMEMIVFSDPQMTNVQPPSLCMEIESVFSNSNPPCNPSNLKPIIQNCRSSFAKMKSFLWSTRVHSIFRMLLFKMRPECVIYGFAIHLGSIHIEVLVVSHSQKCLKQYSRKLLAFHGETYSIHA